MDDKNFIPLEVIDKTEFEDNEFPDELGNKVSNPRDMNYAVKEEKKDE